MARRAVDGRRIGAAVARPAAAVAVDRRVEADVQLEVGPFGFGLGSNATRIRTVFRLGIGDVLVSIVYLPLFASS
jgi:hypothetical protein